LLNIEPARFAVLRFSGLAQSGDVETKSNELPCASLISAVTSAAPADRAGTELLGEEDRP
jgi:hypothetical protein